ncbi:MAG: hypothetical protein KDA42_05835 [Planctomycetales bacterium]|nr:hypothetical protein [Planctomycetales bacterium]
MKYASASVIALLLVAPGACWADEFGPEPTWAIPTWQSLRALNEQMLAVGEYSAEVLERARAFWPEQEMGPADSRLDRTLASFAALDEHAANLVQRCAEPPQLPLDEPWAWLEQGDYSPWFEANVRLYYARYLAEHLLYDEVLQAVADIEPEQVADPAMLLFYRAVARHQIVEHDAGLKDAQKLLERRDEIPARYRHVAELMAADLEGVDPESLDHIARRMGDVGRRLDLGRAGKRVREIEDGVVESLDKLIEKIEKQKQQQQGGGGGGGGQSQPAPDSTPMSGKGPGKVDKKDVGRKSGWGSLPPKQREEAMQEVGKGFPSHYRDAIEQYFRKIANEE